MKNLKYTYLVEKAKNDEQKKLNEKFYKWTKEQGNIRILEINESKITERNKYQIAVKLNNNDDLEKAKRELQERIKRHFKVESGQIIYLLDNKIGQIYEKDKSRPYFVLKGFTSNNKIVILQVTTKKHKNGHQHKIKLNGNKCYIILDEPLTLNKNDVYNARSQITKTNENIIYLKKIQKIIILFKFRRAFK